MSPSLNGVLGQIFVGNVVQGTTLDEFGVKPDWAVVVDKSGKIEATGPSKEILERYSYEITRLLPSEILMPGFIDAHLHAPQFPNIGLHQDLPLLEWLQKYTFPMEHRFKDVEFAERIYPAVIRTTLKRGTTTAAYFCSIHKESSLVLAQEALKQGQRAYVGKVNMDSNVVAKYYEEESVSQSIKDTEWLVDQISNLSTDMVEPIITPRFALTCTGGLMTSLGEIAKKHNLAVQTHVSENLHEIQTAKDLFPKAKDYLEIYENTGLVGKRTLLAHGIHLTEDELQRIKKAEATVVHCPDSNTALCSGFYDAKLQMEAGVNIALGTDISGGAGASVVDAMRYSEQVSKSLAISRGGIPFMDYRRAFLYGTINGARSLGIDNITGSLETGKNFDAVIADPAISTEPELVLDDTPDELLDRFIHTGETESIRKVFVNGVQVHSKCGSKI